MSTLAQLEASRDGSRPVNLYRFDLGAEIFRFTNQPTDYVFNGTTYTALEISSTEPVLNPKERRNNRVTVEGILSQRPFSDFLGVQHSAILQVEIYRVQRDEVVTGSPDQSPALPAAPTTIISMFEGYAVSSTLEERTCKVEFAPLSERLSREIPRYKYSGLCNHVLYDGQCQVVRASYQQTGTVNGVAGNTVTLSGFTGSAFIGGYIEIGAEYRMVLDQSADVLTVLLPFREVVLGESATAYQGCDHSLTTCRDKFNNVVNYGGYPYVPGTNPFTQSQFTRS